MENVASNGAKSISEDQSWQKFDENEVSRDLKVPLKQVEWQAISLGWVGKHHTIWTLHLRPSNPEYSSGKLIGWNIAVYICDMNFITFPPFFLRWNLHLDFEYLQDIVSDSNESNIPLSDTAHVIFGEVKSNFWPWNEKKFDENEVSRDLKVPLKQVEWQAISLGWVGKRYTIWALHLRPSNPEYSSGKLIG